MKQISPLPILPSQIQSRGPTPSGPRLVDEITSWVQPDLLLADIKHWQEDLQERFERVQQHPEQGLGFIEEHMRQSTLERMRLIDDPL